MDYLSDSRSPENPERLSKEPQEVERTRGWATFTSEPLALAAGAAALISILVTPLQQIMMFFLAGEPRLPLWRMFYVVGGNAIFAASAVWLGALGRRRVVGAEPRWAAILSTASMIVGAIALTITLVGAIVFQITEPTPQDVN
jgi:hypothetical protein